MDDETQRLRELDYYRTRLEVSEVQLREAQRKLAATQERYTTLYNLTPAGHMSIDERGAIRQANDTAFEMLGVTRNALRGRTLLNFVAEDDHQIYERFENALLGDNAVHICEVRIVRPNGDRIIAELRGRRVADATENAPFGFIVITDVTAARNMHDELRRRNRELAALNQFARSVSDSLQFEEVITHLKDMLLETSNITTGAIFSYDANQNELHLEAHWGDVPFVDHFAAIPVGGGGDAPKSARRLEQIISGQAPFYARDLRKVPLFQERLQESASVKSGAGDDFAEEVFLFVPMVARGQVEGAIWLFSSQDKPITEDQISYFSTVGQQAGIAMRGARLFADVSHGQERLRLLTRKIVSAQEEERRRVSRELHDEAGQLLTALKISLEMLQEDLIDIEGGARDEGVVHKQLNSAISLNERTMSHIRSLVHNLRPTVLDDLGLNSALEGLCHDFAQRRPVSVDYRQDVDPSLVLPAAAQIVAYRFLQEALTNVSKHAQASEVRVLLQESAGAMRLVVEDDGVGFEMEPETEGIGILGMRERLESVGGRLEIYSEPKNGTRLVAWIPIDT
ncbi:MAG: PAS domain S-box protein [Chloroflexota bacterium]